MICHTLNNKSLWVVSFMICHTLINKNEIHIICLSLNDKSRKHRIVKRLTKKYLVTFSCSISFSFFIFMSVRDI